MTMPAKAILQFMRKQNTYEMVANLTKRVEELERKNNNGRPRQLQADKKIKAVQVAHQVDLTLQGLYCALPEEKVRLIRDEAKRLNKSVNGVMLGITDFFMMRDETEREHILKEQNIPDKRMGRKIK